MKTSVKAVFVLFSTLLLLPTVNCFADDDNDKGPLQAIEFLTGFSQSKIKFYGNYRSIPLLVDFDYDLKPLTSKIGLNPPSLLQFQLEPFISTVYEPNNNVELGGAFLFKVGLLPETFKFQPYLKAGAGMAYITQHTREQSTQFNFIEYAGAGMHYFLTKNTALTLEGRYRHLSNASIKDPNDGIDSCLVVGGASYFF